MRRWIKAICGKKGLPLAPRDTKWSKGEADDRVREHTGATDEPNGDYAKAFVVCDGETDKYGSYKLPFVDVIDGELKAVPKAIEAIAGVLDGSRGGVDLSDDDRTGAKRFVEAYYKAMAEEFDDDSIVVPWADGDTKSFKGYYLGNVEYNMCMASLSEAYYALWYEVWECLCGYDEYDGMEDTDKFEAIDGMLAEFHTLVYQVITAIHGGAAEQSAEEAFKSVRLMAAAKMSHLADGLAYTEHLSMLVDGTKEIVRRSKSRQTLRLKAGRVLSEENRNRLQEHRDSLDEMCSMMATCRDDIDDLLASADGGGEDTDDVPVTNSFNLEYRRKALALQVRTLQLTA